MKKRKSNYKKPVVVRSEVEKDIEYFKKKLDNTTSGQHRYRIKRQIELLENSLVIYGLEAATGERAPER